MGLLDRFLKSPEERLLDLMVELAGKPGFSVIYNPANHNLKLQFSEYALEPQRVALIELARQVDDKFGAPIEHQGNVTISNVTFSPHIGMELIEKYNVKLVKAGKQAVPVKPQPQEEKQITSFAQLLTGQTKDKLIFDYDRDRGLLLIRQEAGSKALTGAEAAFLMKLGKTTLTPKGVSILVDNKQQAHSYAKTVTEMGGNIAQIDLAGLIPSLAADKEKAPRIAEYVAVLKDMKLADPMAWNVLARKEGEHSMKIVFRSEELRDRFTAALPANSRTVQAGVPDDARQALAAKGVEDASMLIVNTAEVVDQIAAYFSRGVKKGK